MEENKNNEIKIKKNIIFIIWLREKSDEGLEFCDWNSAKIDLLEPFSYVHKDLNDR